MTVLISQDTFFSALSCCNEEGDMLVGCLELHCFELS